MLQYFLPAILALGAITSYEDIKTGKIRNRWIILALAYACIVYIGLITYFSFTNGISIHYLIELVTNMVFAIGVGFGLWYFGIWTAGDGKLFIAFSALIPFTSYSIGYQEWIPSITLLINIFVPASLVLVVFILFKLKMKDIKTATMDLLQEFFKPRQLIDSVIYLFAIYWGMQILLSSIGLGNSLFLRLILTMAIYAAVQNKLGNKALYIMLAISLARFALDKSIYSLSFLIDFLLLIFIWRFIKSFLTGSAIKLGSKVFAREIEVNKLKSGMILSEMIEKKQKMTNAEFDNLDKRQDTQIITSRGNYYIKKPKSSLEGKNYIDEESEGLTMKQIKRIQEIGFKKTRVSQTIAFAPLIFLGIIFTIIAKGNILIVIINLLKHLGG